MPRDIEFTIEPGDITSFAADVIALKYAQKPHGADNKVRLMLDSAGQSSKALAPAVGEHVLVKTGNAISAPLALFIGTPPLYGFDYAQIRNFATATLAILAEEAPEATHLAMTIHGPGYGLDESEALLSQFDGCVEGLRAGRFPAALERITIVERNDSRVQRLRQALTEHLSKIGYASRLRQRWGYHLTVTPERRGAKKPAAAKPTAAKQDRASEKPRVFVAMPFKKDFDDVFQIGIYEPTRKAGLTCERADQETFTGDILNWVKARIETAAVVIAELSEANPNVFLEIGYAWGKGRLTILLAKSSEELRFDVRGQRVLKYENLVGLRKSLGKELKELKEQKLI